MGINTNVSIDKLKEKIIEQKEEKECPEFSVDILMDASSSRKKQQEFISAQACVLTKALRACQIPFQISS